MIVTVDATSPVPVVEQLRAQVARHVADGTLRPGDSLPPIRHLAADLGIARGTVAKVYEQLARDGVVRTAGRHGTLVAGTGEGPTMPPAHPEVDLAADALAHVVRAAGLDDAAAHAALAAALGRNRG